MRDEMPTKPAGDTRYSDTISETISELKNAEADVTMKET
jgi:hypothetical protein